MLPSSILNKTQKVMREQMEEMLKKQQEGLRQASMTAHKTQRMSVSERQAEIEKQNSSAVSNLFSKKTVTMSEGVTAMLKRHQNQKQLEASKKAGLASLLASNIDSYDLKELIEGRRDWMGDFAAESGVKSVAQLKDEAKNQLIKDQDNITKKERTQAAARGETLPTKVSVPSAPVRITQGHVPQVASPSSTTVIVPKGTYIRIRV
ncbi:hypothetical protein [Halodesulfovibrio marinisediminis]|uniref:Uncharacterized protein n=1 Tax=Halodesulfovibrio marinisediminis DSM 17456 TaxID=1121457 RepID=A0A1N6I592_9BACT|nr:hypothetical protein [Halodesulfovibrio marinisediminis]SIO27192.1 hypothetical protein SAMN02745161_2424 [Halodesulfovibrio marinisediminis DSM 17456]